MAELSLRLGLRARDLGIGRVIGQIRRNLGMVDRDEASRHRRTMGRLNQVAAGYRRIGAGIRNLTTVAAGLVGASIGAGIVGVFRTGADFEQFQARLEGLEGSSEAARRSMRWVQDFARRTPYQIGEVMDAFIALRNAGIDPTSGSLSVLGDTSAMMGKDLMQAIEMIADAQTGEFERLKEFGLRARQEGNRVTFSWMQNERQIERSTANTAEAIQSTLFDILGGRNAGAMDRLSRTRGGMWSGIMDWFTDFKKQIDDAGLGSFISDQMRSFLDFTETDEGRQRMSDLAREISGALVDAIRSLREALQGVKVGELIRGLVEIVTFIPKVIQFFGGLSNSITALGALGIGKLTFDLGALLAALAPLVGLTGPVGWTIAAVIGAIALAAWLVVRNWSRITTWFKTHLPGLFFALSEGFKQVGAILRGDWKKVWDYLRQDWARLKTLLMAPWRALSGFFRGVWGGIQAAFRAGVNAVWNALPAWFRQVLRGIAFVVRVTANNLRLGGPPGGVPGPGGGRVYNRASAARADVYQGRGQSKDFGGVIDVNVRSDGSATVAARSKSPELAFRARRGPVRAR